MLAVPLSGLVEAKLGEVVGQHRLVLLLEYACVFAESVLAVVIAVLADLVDEEQRQHLDALREQLALLLQVGADDLTDLDAPLRLLGHVLGDLTGADDRSVAQLDDVAVSIDIPNEQPLVRLDAAGDVVQVHALAQPFHLPLDALSGLHLQLDPRLREVRALADLQPIHIQVGGAAGQVLDRDAAHRDLLLSFWL